jgi:Uma2 family endonuclease
MGTGGNFKDTEREGMRSIEVRRRTRLEYEKTIGAGFFAPDERLELIDGDIIRMTPQSCDHAAAVCLAENCLTAAFGPGSTVRPQLPLALDPDSEPEPDIAVVAGTPRDCLNSHPDSALLVIEVADANLDFDRERKAGIYAKAGIADCWIVNLVDRVVEIRRNPGPSPTPGHGWIYGEVRQCEPGCRITPWPVPMRLCRRATSCCNRRGRTRR